MIERTEENEIERRPDEFHAPWRVSTTALVLDPFHENSLDFDLLASERRVAGIIHQATKGFESDKLYDDRKGKAVRRGYKWGSYHFGKPGDPIDQAKFYLDKVQPHDDEVLALDIEDLTDSFMQLPDAERFVAYVRQQTGRYPLMYVTRKVRDAILDQFGEDSEFAKTPLWLAGYRKDNSLRQFFPTQLWRTYTLWQFMSEINCPSKDGLTCPFPQPIPGTDFNMDINVFWGTVDELRAKWPFTFKTEPEQ
jgi:hypothetical protein